MIKKLNQLSSKRPTISYPSSLETNFLQISRSFWYQPMKQVRQKIFSPMIVLTVRTSSSMKSDVHTKPFAVNWKTTNVLMKIFRIIRTWDQGVLMRNKQWRNFNSSQHEHLDGLNTNIYRRVGSNMEWLGLKIFCSFSTIKMLFQPLKQSKFCSVLSSERNWCLKNHQMKVFNPFCESYRDLCEKKREDMTGGSSIV